MTPYHVRSAPLAGTSYAEVAPQARRLLRDLARRTKRRPYIRSAYWHKEKIFFTYFWPHVAQKPLPEQARRLKLLPCALELLQKSRNHPTSKVNVDRPQETLHRFSGLTRTNMPFYTQVKENRRTGHKELMSIVLPQKIPR